MADIEWMHSGTLVKAPSERELAHVRLAREAAAEGIVLLRNEGILPLEAARPVALFGSGADRTVKGGIGSGDVNDRGSISIYRGLIDAGVRVTSGDWLEDHQARYGAARNAWKEKVLADAEKVENPFDAYAARPFVLPEGRAIEDGDVGGAATAVYVISRIAGEGRDRRKEAGDYYLSRKEQEDILFLDQKDIPLVLILNTGGPVELTDILEEARNIKAVLYISLPGQEGGHAVADVLLGHAMPGGRLTATWARRYADYPSAADFGILNGDLEKEIYKEGIYVGYRYFDSFGIEPLFPFGFGLSYTTFSMAFKSLRVAKAGIEVDVAVRNTGERYPGREVVQIYAALPQTSLARERRRLVGFAKTQRLHPGEEQELTILIGQEQLASFSERQQAWIIGAGEYGICIGRDSASQQMAAVIMVAEDTVIERTQQICPVAEPFEEIGAPQLSESRPQDIPVSEFVPHEEEKRVARRAYAKEQPIEDLIPLLYGNITEGAGTLGSAGTRVPGSAGETSQALEERYGIRSLIMADGPAGLRLRQSYEVDRATDQVYGVGVLGSLENGFLEETVHHKDADTYHQYCTAFPVGTALAQTWDVALMRRFGRAIAAEMEEFHVDLWLAPGMNIHRNPLCGRNFEYFSEDPFLSGIMAAAVTEGVQQDGRHGVTIKHFACNEQEDNRMGVDVRISERALREIYLRGFEIAVKKSAPVAMMSSYNKINGIHAANCYDICTVAARGEWGFEGVIMSDWNTTVPKDGSVPWRCAAAGNDIIMPGNPGDAADIRSAYARGDLSEETIRSCAGRILCLIQRLTGQQTENGQE